MSKSTLPECDICQEQCNNSNHKHAQCPKCQADVCRTCIRTYLLNSVQDPCCPNCKHLWDAEFLNNLCGTTWTFQEYRRHRQTLLMDRERAKLPGDVEAIAMYKNYLDRKKEADNFHEEIEAKRQAYLEAIGTQDQMLQEAERLRLNALGLKPKKKDKWKFILPCPGKDCPGYLSTVGKCPVCEQWTCMKCFEQKGPHKNSDHECKEENVASAEHIKKNTKRCPECGVPCVRVSGCTQMWCPQCHTSFSYRTGEVYKDPVHNPERTLWINNGQAAPTRKRKSQAMSSSSSSGGGGATAPPCPTQLVHPSAFRDAMTNMSSSLKNSIGSIYDGVGDLEGYRLGRLRRLAQNQNASKAMRIQYALNVMEEEKMKRILEQQHRKRYHWTQILNVMTLVYEVLRDAIADMVQQKTVASAKRVLKQHKMIMKHAKNRLSQIHRMTKMKVPEIRDYSIMQFTYF